MALTREKKQYSKLPQVIKGIFVADPLSTPWLSEIERLIQNGNSYLCPEEGDDIDLEKAYGNFHQAYIKLKKYSPTSTYEVNIIQTYQLKLFEKFLEVYVVSNEKDIIDDMFQKTRETFKGMAITVLTDMVTTYRDSANAHQSIITVILALAMYILPRDTLIKFISDYSLLSGLWSAYNPEVAENLVVDAINTMKEHTHFTVEEKNLLAKHLSQQFTDEDNAALAKIEHHIDAINQARAEGHAETSAIFIS